MPRRVDFTELFVNASRAEKEMKVSNMREEVAEEKSIEAFGAFFEELACLKVITREQLQRIERLPYSKRVVAYALFIYACPNASEEAKQFADKILQNEM